MSQKTFVALVVILLLLVVGVLVYAYFVDDTFLKNIGMSVSPSPSSGESVVLPLPATGDIDAAINSLVKESSDEGAVNIGLENDAALINSDRTQVENFGQIINDNEF